MNEYLIDLAALDAMNLEHLNRFAGREQKLQRIDAAILGGRFWKAQEAEVL